MRRLALIIALAAVPAAAQAQSLSGLLRDVSRALEATQIINGRTCGYGDGLSRLQCQSQQAQYLLDRVDNDRRADAATAQARREQARQALDTACRAGDRTSCDVLRRF